MNSSYSESEVDTIDNGRRHAIAIAGMVSASTMVPLLSIPSSSQAQQSRYGILGHKAPELDIDYWIDGSGKPANFSLSEHSGKWVFLKCFQNWCPGCHSSGFPTLQKFSTAFHGHPKVAIAGIQTVFEGFGTNTQDAVRELQQRYELPVVMGHDAGQRDAIDHRPMTMVNYRTGGTPWLILIDPDGNVVFNDFHVNTAKLIEYVGEQIA